MTGAEHRQAAVLLLAQAQATVDPADVAYATYLAAVAQVHATLALSANDSDPTAGEATP